MRVALVDSSRTVLKLVTRLLEAGNHEVRPFADGPEALEYIKTDRVVGALITSGVLKSMSGVDLCREARQLASCRRPIYIILMSSDGDRHKLIDALDSGADDYIGKPPIIEEIYARLRAAERFASMQRELIRLAETDSLTGTLNRRAFFERAVEASSRAAAGGALSSIIFDLDHFKQINDVYGHRVGDDVLRSVAREALTESGLIGRLGGEEFAVLLEGATISAAVEVAERLRCKIAKLRFETDVGVMTLTCSLGVSEWEASDSIDRLLKRADRALYKAKNSGRDRVVFADPASPITNDTSESRVVRSDTRGKTRPQSTLLND
jgi:two-component system cell cycle response regulator